MKANKYKDIPKTQTDAFLIGGGIMSTTLGMFLALLKPNWKIQISERGEQGGLESSAALNNAGTGHAGYCELNYTPEDENGNIDVTKALKVNEAFGKSMLFWHFLTTEGYIKRDFRTSVPHISFVHGKDNVEYLFKRYKAMSKYACFMSMEYTSDIETLKKWMPLVMNGRDTSEPIAATRCKDGGDIDFGKLTKYLIQALHDKGVLISENQEVIDLYKQDGKWNVIQRNTMTNNLTCIETNFLFIGAGGASITLLEKSEIPEGKGYGGFPVSGEWLICENPEIVKQHNSKVYGKPSIGAPPMSVPHLDKRFIDGTEVLLFGPYAGLSTKFLKFGKWTDFFKSINISNIGVMLNAGVRNLGLSKYLLLELVKTKAARFRVLKDYYPNAKKEDWKPAIAGQRVQVIKKVNGKGVIEFGTEIVTSSDGSIACLLGASPGASTAVKAMLDVIDKCIKLEPKELEVLNNIIPSNKKTLALVNY